MAIIKDAELWFCRLDPKYPNSKFNPENPAWECQLRTTSKEQKKEWESMGLPVKAIVPDEGETYFRVNLRKKSIKEDGSKASPVEVVGGDLEPIDPSTIGSGSVGNVRVWQYEYTRKDGGKATAAILMAVQVTKLIVAKQKPRKERETFQQSDMKIIDPDAIPSDESF